MARHCFLKCVMNSHPPIKLPHREMVIVGRSKDTKIKDQSCSRKQLSFTADCDTCFVEVKQLGPNPAGVDGFALVRYGVYRLEHGSRIEILLNHYIHVIEFSPTPPNMSSPLAQAGKRKLDNFTCSMYEKIPKMDIPEEQLKEAPGNVWESIDKGELYIFTSKGVKSSKKIAGFDMDGTLIKTKSNRVYPVDIDDWQIAFPTVIEKLKQLFTDGFKLVILSNQAPIGNGRVKIADFKKKIEGLAEKLSVPVQVYIATGKGFYRKPATGMWKVLIEQKNDGLTVDKENSFYCGDAAGRVANWAPGKRKDHSMADKLLAENLGLQFYTPEEFFLGHSLQHVQMVRPEFDPSDVYSGPFKDELINKKQEIIVLVGFPGSGKSFLAKQIEQKSNHKYATVCRDVLGSWQKCAAKATELLKQGKSVIVDSTNPDVESRARWIALARDQGVGCRCVRLAVSMAHARHNNKFRELMKTNHMQVNDIVYHTYKNKFVEPSVDEGFQQVVTVPFNANFEDATTESVYKMHLLEK